MLLDVSVPAFDGRRDPANHHEPIVQLVDLIIVAIDRSLINAALVRGYLVDVDAEPALRISLFERWSSNCCAQENVLDVEIVLGQDPHCPDDAKIGVAKGTRRKASSIKQQFVCGCVCLGVVVVECV